MFIDRIALKFLGRIAVLLLNLSENRSFILVIIRGVLRQRLCILFVFLVDKIIRKQIILSRRVEAGQRDLVTLFLVHQFRLCNAMLLQDKLIILHGDIVIAIDYFFQRKFLMIIYFSI